MLYSRLYSKFEKVRWNMESDIDWSGFNAALLSDEQALTVKMNAITEWAALPATEMFLRDNRQDSDFSAFMSIWFYEEQKHALVLMEYLRRFRPELVPAESELHQVRFEFDPAPPLETLMLHFGGEIRLMQWYLRAADWHSEPVIKRIYQLIAADEARHAGAYYRYMERAVRQNGDAARLAFAKIGVLMAGAMRSSKPVHPTNLHVNESLFPNDTVQSRLPEPDWLEHWLERQIQFTSQHEHRVTSIILAKLGTLLDITLPDVKSLRQYRRDLTRQLQVAT
jgi:hypothetical protein